jgi:GH35 family endo-1,4-beta-xylanase
MSNRSSVVGGNKNRPGLKDVYKNHFLIGTAGDLPGGYTDEELALVQGHFNVVTAENCLKPGPVHPAEDRWSFERSDALVRWCEDSRIPIHGHTLVWHQQTNNWFFRDGAKKIVTKRLKEHVSSLVGRYRGKIRGWDVVNEAIKDGGTHKTAKTENLRNTSWMKALGQDYIALAFRFAHDADPDATLYYNDYDIEAGPKHDSSLVLLNRLIELDVPIHGVGIQGHWRASTVPYTEIDKAIGDYSLLGLKVSISELDVAVGDLSGRASGRGKVEAAAPTPEDLEAQADAYARLFAILVKHEKTVERVTFWGLNDRRSWRSGQYPLIFDSSNQRKPAYTAIVDAL